MITEDLSCVCGVLVCSSKLTGMAFRVPVPDVSVVDLTVKLRDAVRLPPVHFGPHMHTQLW